ncbi:glutamate synthase-related protein [Streptomyces sp. NPDC050732]|uniref:glutamate synthase-related protein n=1 Tax=Streptomyces sp. NPDC050732 TaxID=3154632 RepID=UPI003439D970
MTTTARPSAAPGVVSADGFPAGPVRERARLGVAAVFPDAREYGTSLYGAPGAEAGPHPPDLLDRARIVPPVFMPDRLAALVELGREPLYDDVRLRVPMGGFTSALPLYVSAFGSTRIASGTLGEAVARQAGRLGIPLVVGENVAPVNGYRSTAGDEVSSLLSRIHAYAEAAGEGQTGGVAVQQSTEDADAEVWNQVYSDPACGALLDGGRLAFELKVGQGAKPGLGGMTVLGEEAADRVADLYATDAVLSRGSVLRSSAPGTFTEEILRQQIRQMRNNFPRARVWVKLHPGRDVDLAARTAWEAGADAVTVDGAEGGTGWAPTCFLSQVGLPLGECLHRIGPTPHCLLASGRMWEGTRVLKALALGARGAGLGRAAIIAAAEDADTGLVRLVESIALELRLLLSALGRYGVESLCGEDLWISPQA